MGRIAFLLGALAAPLVLLLLGHHFRRRTPRLRTLFWGATAGYLAGMLLALAAALLPPVHWTETTPLRAFAVHWSMLLGTVAGAVVALLGGARKVS